MPTELDGSRFVPENAPFLPERRDGERNEGSVQQSTRKRPNRRHKNVLTAQRSIWEEKRSRNGTGCPFVRRQSLIVNWRNRNNHHNKVVINNASDDTAVFKVHKPAHCNPVAAGNERTDVLRGNNQGRRPRTACGARELHVRTPSPAALLILGQAIRGRYSSNVHAQDLQNRRAHDTRRDEVHNGIPSCMPGPGEHPKED